MSETRSCNGQNTVLPERHLCRFLLSVQCLEERDIRGNERRDATRRDTRCDPRVNVRCAAESEGASERAPEDEQTPRGDWLPAWVKR